MEVPGTSGNTHETLALYQEMGVDNIDSEGESDGEGFGGLYGDYDGIYNCLYEGDRGSSTESYCCSSDDDYVPGGQNDERPALTSIAYSEDEAMPPEPPKRKRKKKDSRLPSGLDASKWVEGYVDLDPLPPFNEDSGFQLSHSR